VYIIISVRFFRYGELISYSYDSEDYVGSPRDNKWGNSHAINKYHHQLEMAKSYGADKMWIVNVSTNDMFCAGLILV